MLSIMLYLIGIVVTAIVLQPERMDLWENYPILKSSFFTFACRMIPLAILFNFLIKVKNTIYRFFYKYGKHRSWGATTSVIVFFLIVVIVAILHTLILNCLIKLIAFLWN